MRARFDWINRSDPARGLLSEAVQADARPDKDPCPVPYGPRLTVVSHDA